MISSMALICSFVAPFVLLVAQENSDESQSAAARSACEEIYGAMLSIPGTAVDRYEGTFYYEDVQRKLEGCLIVVSGSWGELGGRSNPGDSVYALLSDQGWVQEPQYSADGPDGTFFAVSKDDIWCFIRGQWDGGDDSDSTYVPSDVYQFVICCAPFVAPGPADDEGE